MTIATLNNQQHRFRELIEQHQGIVGKITQTYCWHIDDREELSQEILTQLWRAFPNYDDAKPFSTWMYRVALNVSISWVRSNSIRQRHMTALGDNVNQLADTSYANAEDERISFLKTFIETLDTLNRALVLLYLEEYSYQEISEVLGITETNVATKLSRIKQRVRQQSEQTIDKGASNGTR